MGNKKDQNETEKDQHTNSKSSKAEAVDLQTVANEYVAPENEIP